MQAEILLATRSAHKAREINEILRAAIKLKTLNELNIPEAEDEAVLERFDSFLENAIAKAEYFSERTGLPTLADDSGIVVDALKGAPGVRTKRFAIDEGFVSSATSGVELDNANNRLLLKKLEGVAERDRTARYVCAAALSKPDLTLVTAVGSCPGVFAYEPRGTDGFGYDPLFFLPDLQRTFAELSSAEKNARSHRARAFRALRAHLK